MTSTSPKKYQENTVSDIKGTYFDKIEFKEVSCKKDAEKMKEKKEKQGHQVLMKKYDNHYILTIFEGKQS